MAISSYDIGARVEVDGCQKITSWNVKTSHAKFSELQYTGGDRDA